jgi:NAD(P) transhydrogenase subunit beta
MTGRPIIFPGNQFINAGLLLGILGLIVYLATGKESEGLFVAMLVAALIFGVLLIIPVGGADMPVVISMLNAFTGLSAAGAGFVLDNTALIIAGSLVGSSGTLLTILMGRAMNRSLSNVLFGAFGAAAPGAAAAGDGAGGTVREVNANDVAAMLAYADRVVVVPGYGLAVAQAQHTVRELADELEKRGVEVSYAIHPVAGRMPGHMNVLLAEADVPYEALREMDEINPEFPSTDVALVIGANDVTNPAARHDQSSPIYGMPILDVDKSRQVVVLKRSMNPGFAGIENELYYQEQTAMLFGDAKDSVAKLVNEVKNA